MRLMRNMLQRGWVAVLGGFVLTIVLLSGGTKLFLRAQVQTGGSCTIGDGSSGTMKECTFENGKTCGKEGQNFITGYCCSKVPEAPMSMNFQKEIETCCDGFKSDAMGQCKKTNLLVPKRILNVVERARRGRHAGEAI